jgi:Protein of unknown function (DUF3298)/Deacetylase PdaC
MVKINLNFIIILINLALIVVSCNTNKSSEGKSEKDTTLRIEKIQIDKKNGDCEKSNNNCAVVKIEYPELVQESNENAVKKINENIILQLLQPIMDEGEYNSIDTLIKSFFDEFDQVVKENPKLGQSWEIERIMVVKNQTDKILSIEYSDYSFLGGAHPNTFVSFSNYSLTNGEEISLDDCLIKGYENQLNSVGEKIFRQKKKLSENSDLSSAGYWFDEDRFELNDNFAILKEGLLFYFNSYDVAPYAAGPTEIMIPYSEITHLILPDGPLAEFIKK